MSQRFITAPLPILHCCVFAGAQYLPGWLAVMIDDHQCGFSVTAENPAAFADALEQAASDRPALLAMVQRGLALAKAQFARQAFSDRWVDWGTGVKA